MITDFERLTKRITVAKAGHKKHKTRASSKLLKRAQRQMITAKRRLAKYESRHPKMVKKAEE